MQKKGNIDYDVNYDDLSVENDDEYGYGSEDYAGSSYDKEKKKRSDLSFDTDNITDLNYIGPNKDDYNKSKEYVQKVAPIVKDLKLMCNNLRLPMFVTVAVANNAESTEYVSDMVLASTKIHLSDNKIAQCLLHLNNMDVEPPMRVKRAISTLVEYYTSIYNEDDERFKPLGLELKTDLIEGMNKISKGNNHAKLPKNTIGVEMDEDLDEDLDDDLDVDLDDLLSDDDE